MHHISRIFVSIFTSFIDHSLNDALEDYLMAKKPTYEELEQRVEELENEALKRKQVEDALQERNSQLHLLNQSGRVLNSSLDLDRVLASLLEEVRVFMDVAGSSIWVKDTPAREIICRQAAGIQADIVCGWRMPEGNGIAGRVSSRGEAIIVQDTRRDDRHFKGVDKEMGYEIRSILSVPLMGKTGPIGALQMVDTKVGRFDETHLEIMESLASSSAIAIENAGLYRQAQDEIYERKKAEEALRKAHDELEEINSALSILLKMRQRDKEEVEKKVVSNVKALIEPYLKKLKKTKLTPDQGIYLKILQANLGDILSPFLRNLAMNYSGFTPKEIQVASLVKEGKNTKEIAGLMEITKRAVEFHRHNLRAKLGLHTRKANLRTYLLSIP